MNAQQPESEERRPRRPRDIEVTAVGPSSVEESVYTEAEHVGREGPNASSRPTAEDKPQEHDAEGAGPGSDLDPDEAADVLKTQREAQRIRDAKRDDTQDENVISLDVPD